MTPYWNNYPLEVVSTMRFLLPRILLRLVTAPAALDADVYG